MKSTGHKIIRKKKLINSPPLKWSMKNSFFMLTSLEADHRGRYTGMTHQENERAPRQNSLSREVQLREDTQLLPNRPTCTTGPASCREVTSLIHCETRYIKLKTVTGLCVYSVFSLERSARPHLALTTARPIH